MSDVGERLLAELQCIREVLEEVQKLVVHAYSADPPVMIRSLDAVHVASALASRAVWVVATDTRLRDAATSMGFRVAP